MRISRIAAATEIVRASKGVIDVARDAPRVGDRRTPLPESALSHIFRKRVLTVWT